MKRQTLISALSIFIFVLVVGVLATESYAAEKPDLKFQLKSGEKLFDIEDIVRFDWDKQIFELSRQSAMDLLGKQTGLYRKFTVRSGTETIYSGTLVSSLSSIAFRGPVIVFDRENIGGMKPPLFAIENGYPGPLGKSDPDLRFSERFKKALQQASVLGKIDLNEPPVPIERVTHGWFGEKDSLRTLVEIFPETLRLGEIARMHLHLMGAEHVGNQANIIEVNVNLKANNGKFKHSVRQTFPISRDKRREVYILQMLLWGCAKDYYAKAGPAEISMEIFAKKAINENTKNATDSGRIGHLSVKSIPLTILPPTSKLRYGIPGHTSIWKELAVMREGDQFTTNDNSFILEEVGQSTWEFCRTYAVMSYIYDPHVTLIAIDRQGKDFSPTPYDSGHSWPPKRIKERFCFKLSKENLSHFILLEQISKPYVIINKVGEKGDARVEVDKR